MWAHFICIECHRAASVRVRQYFENNSIYLEILVLLLVPTVFFLISNFTNRGNLNSSLSYVFLRVYMGLPGRGDDTIEFVGYLLNPTDSLQ